MSRAAKASTVDESIVDMIPDERFDRQQVAEMIDRTVSTLDRYVARGLIGFVRIGGRVYFTREHVDTFLATYVRYVQPEIPGLELVGNDEDPPFTEEQASRAARALDGHRADKARRRSGGTGPSG